MIMVNGGKPPVGPEGHSYFGGSLMAKPKQPIPMMYGQGQPANFTPNPYYRPPADPYQRTSTGAIRPVSNDSYKAGVAAQSGKDMTALTSAANLGIAGQNAMGQYGMGKDQALVNSQIAQANALGQMSNNYHNAMAQGMYVSGALGAAGAAAGAQSNVAGALNGMFGGGNFGGNMSVSGPGGFGATGSWGGSRSGGGGGGGGGGQSYNPYTPIDSGFKSLGDFRRDLNDRDGMGNRLRNDVNMGFGMTQRNLMDPSIRNQMMEQMRMGYGALDGLYDKSDYGFNTGAQGVSQQLGPWGLTRRSGF